jgi:hypothetical protein
MSHQSEYDALDTIQWMLGEARKELDSETVPGANGRAKRKTKAQIHDDQVRFATLCEVIWNVTGRRQPLEEIRERALA